MIILHVVRVNTYLISKKKKKNVQKLNKKGKLWTLNKIILNVSRY